MYLLTWLWHFVWPRLTHNIIFSVYTETPLEVPSSESHLQIAIIKEPEHKTPLKTGLYASAIYDWIEAQVIFVSKEFDSAFVRAQSLCLCAHAYRECLPVQGSRLLKECVVRKSHAYKADWTLVTFFLLAHSKTFSFQLTCIMPFCWSFHLRITTMPIAIKSMYCTVMEQKNFFSFAVVWCS